MCIINMCSHEIKIYMHKLRGLMRDTDLGLKDLNMY